MSLLTFAVIIIVAASAVATSTARGQTPKSVYVRELVFTAPAATQPLEIEHETNFLDWYQDGVHSYLANDWANCVHFVGRAIAGYRDYYTATASCRLKCRRVAADASPLYDEDVDDLRYYESIIRRTLCLAKCKQLLLPQFDEFFEMSAWSQEVFRSRKPYTYLQLCHFRLGDVPNAAHATFTALLSNPTDTMMDKNFRFYMDKLEPHFAVEDLEQRPFAVFYLRGLRAYRDENYTAVVENMERSLRQFQYDRDECRAFCENDYEHGWLPDMVTSAANHFTYSLRCKANCTANLANIRGIHYGDIFASHYEYMHISYYKVNRTVDACRAAASFMEIRPDTTEMLTNLVYYQRHVAPPICIPRRESEHYAAQLRYEGQLLAFVADEFADVRIKVPARKLQAIRYNAAATDEILRQD